MFEKLFRKLFKAHNQRSEDLRIFIVTLFFLYKPRFSREKSLFKEKTGLIEECGIQEKVLTLKSRVPTRLVFCIRVESAIEPSQKNSIESSQQSSRVRKIQSSRVKNRVESGKKCRVEPRIESSRKNSIDSS